MLRKIRFASYGLIALLAVAWAAVWLREDGAAKLRLDSLGITLPGGVSVGGPFALVGTDGVAVTDATYRGRWMLIYFGYTFCPDVCPTELQVVSTALDQLGADAAKLVPLFITIDPERDTPATLAEYVKLFDERLVGLTGSPEQIAAAARAYRVYFGKAGSKTGTDYLMDHSSFLYLVDPDGKFRALFKSGTSATELVSALRSRLAVQG